MTRDSASAGRCICRCKISPARTGGAQNEKTPRHCWCSMIFVGIAKAVAVQGGLYERRTSAVAPSRMCLSVSMWLVAKLCSCSTAPNGARKATPKRRYDTQRQQTRQDAGQKQAQFEVADQTKQHATVRKAPIKEGFHDV